MSNLDNAELGGEALGSDEVIYLQNLTNSFGKVVFDRQRFLVSVENAGGYSIFCSTNMLDGNGSSFVCNHANGEVTQMTNCDISWVRAFLNGYREIED